MPDVSVLRLCCVWVPVAWVLVPVAPVAPVALEVLEVLGVPGVPEVLLKEKG